MLLNVNAVNEVVRHVTFIEYQLYEETDTTITSSAVQLNSSKYAQASDYQIFEEIPYGFGVCLFRITQQAWWKTKPKTVIENKNLLSQQEIREFHSPWEPASFTGFVHFLRPSRALCSYCMPSCHSELTSHRFPSSFIPLCSHSETLLLL